MAGQAQYNDSWTVGKVQTSHGALYIPVGGTEVPIHLEIEVLVEHWFRSSFERNFYIK